MRSRPFALAVALVAAVGIVLPLAPITAPTAAAAPVPIVQGTISGPGAVAELSAVFTAINDYRGSQGLRPLRFMPQLHTIAQSWSYEMGQSDTLAHRPSFWTLYPAGSSKSGEIWARDSSPAGLIKRWIASPAHRAQLLGDYTAMGVGVARVQGFQGAAYSTLLGVTNFGRYIGSSQPTTYASVEAWVNAGGRVAPAPAPLPDTEFARIAARDTMQASIDLSVQRNQPSQVTEVYLAPSHVYFEALAAAPAAARAGRALLLVEPSGPSQALLDELRRLNPSTVTLVGATDVLPDATLSAVRAALPGKSVARVGGSNASEISVNFARQEFPGADRVFVAAERNLSDAISAASAAAALGVPLVLTPRSTDIPAGVTSYFAVERPGAVTIVGGSPQLASAQQRAIQSAGSGISATLVRERDRFLTNASTLRTAWSGQQDAAYLASALQFGHAFVGSAIAVGDGPVALTSIGCVPPDPYAFVAGSDPQRVVALGSEWTVSANAAALGRCAS